jgi:hypothetical protein
MTWDQVDLEKHFARFDSKTGTGHGATGGPHGRGARRPAPPPLGSRVPDNRQRRAMRLGKGARRGRAAGDAFLRPAAFRRHLLGQAVRQQPRRHIADVLVPQLGFQGVKELSKQISGPGEANDCTCRK